MWGHQDQHLDPLRADVSRALVLGRLARGLLHELANGSAAISGLAELSLEGLAPGSRDHQHLLLIRDAAGAEADQAKARELASR